MRDRLALHDDRRSTRRSPTACWAMPTKPTTRTRRPFATPVAPSCPAALAMAEREGRNGTAFLRAVALGYDVGTRLNMALHAYDFRDAGHSTHSFGPTFGAAAAAGALANLNADEARWLLSYAAQQCSGVSCWMRDEEHVEKAFDFGGMPARNGVVAATMVAAGFTGVDDVFSGERNFFIAYDETRRIGGRPSRSAWCTGSARPTRS